MKAAQNSFLEGVKAYGISQDLKYSLENKSSSGMDRTQDLA